MFDYSYFETLSEGDEKLRDLKKCIVTADHEKNISEALELRDGDKSKFGGKGVSRAVENINTTINTRKSC